MSLEQLYPYIVWGYVGLRFFILITSCDFPHRATLPGCWRLIDGWQEAYEKMMKERDKYKDREGQEVRALAWNHKREINELVDKYEKQIKELREGLYISEGVVNG